MSAWLSTGSLFFGFAAWGIPVVEINLHQKAQGIRNYSLYSFTLCAIAVVLQLFEIKHRVALGDFSSIMDTIGATTVAAVILVVVTVMLNAICIVLSKEKIDRA